MDFASELRRLADKAEEKADPSNRLVVKDRQGDSIVLKAENDDHIDIFISTDEHRFSQQLWFSRSLPGFGEFVAALTYFYVTGKLPG